MDGPGPGGGRHGGGPGATAGVPDGFVPYKEPSPFLDRVGPLYERDGDAVGFVLGLLVLEYHCNRRGFAHGGILVTLADMALGKTGERRSDPPASLLTASLTFDFVGVARHGEWVEARCDFHRVGRTLAFANCYLTSGTRVVGRASGAFKVATGRNRHAGRDQGRAAREVGEPGAT